MASSDVLPGVSLGASTGRSLLHGWGHCPSGGDLPTGQEARCGDTLILAEGPSNHTEGMLNGRRLQGFLFSKSYDGCILCRCLTSSTGCRVFLGQSMQMLLCSSTSAMRPDSSGPRDEGRMSSAASMGRCGALVGHA